MRYQGSDIKIGTCELLYYTTFQKYVAALQSGFLKQAANGGDPAFYAQPDSGFLFRFPFPDEDKIQLGHFTDFQIDHNRGIPVSVPASLLPKADSSGKPLSEPFQVEIVHQKFVHRISDGKLCLAVVCRGPDKFQRFRIEDEEGVNCLLRSIIRNYIIGEPDSVKKNFYKEIGSRILKGYRLGIPNQDQTVQETLKKKTKQAPALKRKRFGRGI